MDKPDWLVKGNVIEFSRIPDVGLQFRNAIGRARIVRESSQGKSLTGSPYFFDAEILTSDIHADRLVAQTFGFFERNFIQLIDGERRSGASLHIPKEIPPHCQWRVEEQISEIRIPEHLTHFVYARGEKLVADGCDSEGAMREIDALKEKEWSRAFRLRREWPTCHQGGTVNMRWVGTALVYACSKCCDGDERVGNLL